MQFRHSGWSDHPVYRADSGLIKRLLSVEIPVQLLGILEKSFQRTELALLVRESIKMHVVGEVAARVCVCVSRTVRHSVFFMC